MNIELVALWASFVVGAFYRIADRAFHAAAGPDKSIATVWDFFRRESGWFIARLAVAALLFLSVTHGVAMPLGTGIAFGLTFGIAFETAVDSMQKHAQRNGNGAGNPT